MPGGRAGNENPSGPPAFAPEETGRQGGKEELMTVMEEAVLPALKRLNWRHLEMPDAPALVVPIACPTPSPGALLMTIEANDAAEEALFFVGVCDPPPSRRPAAALLLAELNTRYPHVTFSMPAQGEVRVDVDVSLAGTVPEMRPGLIELGIRRLLFALGETHAGLLAIAQGRRRRRPRVEREVDAVLRKVDR
jgi:hypothetical protein